jgi:hypothetical protein
MISQCRYLRAKAELFRKEKLAELEGRQEQISDSDKRKLIEQIELQSQEIEAVKEELSFFKRLLEKKDS